jgi:fermentation-respiration switch protein FrsA (DUF1100 family)
LSGRRASDRLSWVEQRDAGAKFVSAVLDLNRRGRRDSLRDFSLYLSALSAVKKLLTKRGKKHVVEVLDSTSFRNRYPWRFRMVQLLTLFIVGYIGVVIVLLFLENKLLFHPIQASDEWLEPPSPRVQDVVLQSAAGDQIHAWWYPTAKWHPEQGAVLYCHGNAGNLSHRGEAIGRWQERLGQAVLIIDYPGYGWSSGKPSERGCYAAADAAYDWLTQTMKVPAESVILYGGSLGGAVAVDVASRRPHRAVVLVSTFTSIPDMAQKQYPWLPARWLVRNRFDNLEKISKCTKPIFVAHGTADSLIPFSQGERLFAAASEPKHFFPMQGYDHNHTPGPDFYVALRKFLAEAEATTLQESAMTPIGP